MDKKNNKKILIKNFANNYFDKLEKTFKRISTDKINDAANLILKTIKSKKTIYVCGNGGSAAIANHFVCDYFKQLSKYTKLKTQIKA